LTSSSVLLTLNIRHDMKRYTPDDCFMKPSIESIEVVSVLKRHLHLARFKSTDELREDALYACRAAADCLYPSKRTIGMSRLVGSLEEDVDDT
jgi:hypothetical protein